MIDKVSANVSLRGLTVPNIVGYLQSKGWTVDEKNPRWVVAVGGHDAHDRPVEVVLPRDQEDADLPIYIRNAVELVAALEDRPVEAAVRQIMFYDRDVLRVRNLETGVENSISLYVAWKQVTELKQLVLFSAEAEQHARPYFPKGHINRSARKMGNLYRFGHTFVGSFGLTIECPIVNQQRVYQLSLLEQGQVIVPPIERRVMERIVRGLVIAEEAPRVQDVDLLRNQYASGFNANMCKAVIGIAEEQGAAVEFAIAWSSKIEPSQDIIQPGPIRLSKVSYDYLEYAAKELRKIRPEPVIVNGLVESLTAKGDPRSLSGSERTVVIRWLNTPTGRPRNVIVNLNTKDYMDAIRAHENYQHVEVQGELQPTGSAWRLTNPVHFRVI